MRVMWQLGLAGALLASGAWAQGVPVPGATAPNTAETDTGEIGDIVVTANRREERLQDVPIAITAVSGATLAERAIFDVTRLQEIAPGLQVGRSGSDARPAIRGINTEAIGANSDPRVAFYIDDIYLSRTSQALAGFLDLNRVEVQRGPQGTLFGRNSFGGNIVLYSNTPTDRLEAAGSVLFGEYDRFRVEGSVNVPINEAISTRVAAFYERQDGFVKNTVLTGSDLGDEDQYFIRGSVRIAPPGSGLEVILRASYWDQGGAGISAFGYKTFGTPVNPDLVRAPGGAINIGGRNVVFPNGFNGADAFGRVNANANGRFRDNLPDFSGTNGVRADIGVPIEQNPYRVNFDAVVPRKTNFTLLSAHISYDFGPVTFRSITGYSDFYALRASDNDFSPSPIAIDFNESNVQTFSQEIQLLSSDKASPFQWIIGGYYYDDHIREVFFSDNNLAFFTSPTNPIFAGGGLGLTTTAPISPTRSDAFAPVQVQTKSYAGFAQASYELLERLRLTGGIRFTSDEKRYNAGITTAAPASGFQFLLGQPVDYGPCANINTPAAGNNVPNALRIQCGRDTFEQVTYRAAIDYKVTDRNLVYASFSTGFRSGGFNNVLSDPANINSPVISFAPEQVRAYEIGTKNQFFDNKLLLNVAGFYNDYNGLQVQRQVPAPNGLTTFSIIENSGLGRSYGLELEAVAKPTRALTISLAYVYTNAEYTKYETGTAANGLGPLLGCPAATNPAVSPSAGRNYACEAGGFSPNGWAFPNGLADPDRFRLVTVLPNGNPVYNYIIAGNNGAGGRNFSARVPLIPRNQITASVAYEIDLGDAGTITPFVQLYYNSGFHNLDLNLPIDFQDAYTRTDLRITYTTRSERFSLQGFVENLEDEAVLNRSAIGANRALNANYALPRIWGIRASGRF